MPTAMLEVKGLTKKYGTVLAVNNLSFTIHKGEVFGFLGPNGAGKTSTMRMITNYIPATSGTVTVDGLDIKEHDLAVRKKIGYLPETTPLYNDMLVDEYLSFVATLRGLSGDKRTTQVEKLLTLCGLQTLRKRAIGHLSKGYRQRVGLAQALVHEPDLLILDEPMSGLDPNQIIEIRELIKEIGKEKTVIYCSHILSEVAATCNRILIINHGEAVILGTPEEVSKATSEKLTYTVTLQQGEEKSVRAILKNEKAVGEVLSIATLDSGLQIQLECTDSTASGAAFFNLATQHGWILTELTPAKRSLEDVFTLLTRNETHE